MPMRIRRILFLLAVAELASCRPRTRPPAPAVVAQPQKAPDDLWVASATRVRIGGGQELVLGGGSKNAALWDGETWTPLAPMPAARAGCTATLLPDGRVLVTGGIATGIVDEYEMELVFASALIWSRDLGFVLVAPMSMPRDGHTATMLLDGRVLVIGGEEFNDGLSPVASAEIYDPELDRWTATGALARGRQDHSADLLPDGRVIVIGGEDEDAGTTASIEIWDPLDGAFTPGGQLAKSRLGARVTVMSDRQVLVAGGVSIDPPLEGGGSVREDLSDADVEVVLVAPRGAPLP